MLQLPHHDMQTASESGCFPPPLQPSLEAHLEHVRPCAGVHGPASQVERRKQANTQKPLKRVLIKENATENSLESNQFGLLPCHLFQP